LFVFGGSKLAHFNFVGDSILGSGVNAVIAPGAILAPDTIVRRLSLVDQAVRTSGA